MISSASQESVRTTCAGVAMLEIHAQLMISALVTIIAVRLCPRGSRGGSAFLERDSMKLAIKTLSVKTTWFAQKIKTTKKIKNSIVFKDGPRQKDHGQEMLDYAKVEL